MLSKLIILVASVVVGQKVHRNQCSYNSKDSLYSDCHDVSSDSCELVENSYGKSCLELRAKPFITDKESQFGSLIEGAGVNPKGELFGVNYGNSSQAYQLGKFYPKQELIYIDPDINSNFNGIRFFNSKMAVVADKTHRVLKLHLKNGKVIKSSTFCSDPSMIEPNDLAIARTGTLFASGQRFKDVTDKTDGDLWSCTPDGKPQKLHAMGRTNGIELSPDEKYLYISESYDVNNRPVARKIWKYSVNTTDGTVGYRKLFLDFVKIDKTSGYNDIDGMKFDKAGNLFVTRHNKGEINIFNPDAKLIGRIKLSFLRCTNLDFGGDDGKTLFIVGQCPEYDTQGIGKGCVDMIRFKTPGSTWTKFRGEYSN